MGSHKRYVPALVETLEDRRLMSATPWLHADRAPHHPTVAAVIASPAAKAHRVDAPRIVRRPSHDNATLPAAPVSSAPAPIAPPVSSDPPVPVAPPVSSDPPITSDPPLPVSPPVSADPPVTSDPPVPVPPPASSEPTPAPPLAGSWATVFDDEFTGNSPASVWVPHQYWSTGATAGEGVEESAPYNVSVSNGMLQLNAQADNTFNTGFTGALVQAGGIQGQTTSSPAAFLYGYAEARILIPPGQGLWPAFWLMPEASITTGVNHDGQGEIDIMEILDGQPNTLYGTVHQGSAQAQNTFTSPTPLTAGWHTYAVNWEPGSITWFIDGTSYGTYTGPLVPSTPMYPIFDLAVGGSWGGMPDASTPLPATMAVDFIRIWQPAAAPSFTSPDAASFTAGQPGTFTVTTSGSPLPSISTSSPLPAGLTLLDNGNGTATLSGTPAAGTAGDYTLTLLASNVAGSGATQSLTITIA